MAQIVERRNRVGQVTSYQVRWRAGGSRTGAGQSERFDDRPSAEVFRDAVNEHGQTWPPGWVKGRGYVDQEAAEPDEMRFRFRAYALAMYKTKTGIEEHYRQACLRDFERWIFPTWGECDVRSTEHFSGDTISAWVRRLEQTKVRKGQMPKTGKPKVHPMSPKTIRNLHGLLSAVLEKAVKAEPPLRARNPCELTSLPRADDDGADGSEDIEFLTPAEVDGLISCMERRSDQLLATIKYGTGMRWSEVTALGPVSLHNWSSPRPQVRVKRAWKRDGHGGYYLGTPKSRRGRRSLRVSETVVQAIQELGGSARGEEEAEQLFFHSEQRQRLHYSTFYGRWQRAVKRAKAQELLPEYKHPTPHDLRHSHAALLISEGRGLTYVQRRLGHESIKTTSDTYGHLLPEADDDAMEAIERSLGRSSVDDGQATEAKNVDRSRVYVAHLGDDHVEAFWRSSDARATAEQWQLDRCRSARVETWSADWWRRQHGNGVKDVREDLPGRVQVWSMGPAVYGPDGTEQATVPDAHDLQARWVWAWEDGYLTEPARCRVEHLPAPSRMTEAEAWGTDREQVRAMYARARADALAICGETPAVTSQEVR